MRCHICNAVLSPDEIKIHPQHKDHEPCWTCLKVIDELFEPPSEEELSAVFLEDDPAEDPLTSLA